MRKTPSGHACLTDPGHPRSWPELEGLGDSEGFHAGPVQDLQGQDMQTVGGLTWTQTWREQEDGARGWTDLELGVPLTKVYTQKKGGSCASRHAPPGSQSWSRVRGANQAWEVTAHNYPVSEAGEMPSPSESLPAAPGRGRRWGCAPQRARQGSGGQSTELGSR